MKPGSATLVDKCWVCGKEAESREHRIKRGVLAGVFAKPVNQQTPVQYRSASKKVPIGSLKADRLKFPKHICGFCNSTRTKKNDLALQHLFDFLRTECHPLRAGDRINLWRVFPDSPLAGMINVQLYFAKVLGSAIRESDVPIDLYSFSSAIMQQSPHQSLYLLFGTMQDGPRHAGFSDFVFDGSCASFIYTAGEVSVTVLYAPQSEDRAGKQNAWHPMLLSDYLQIGAL